MMNIRKRVKFIYSHKIFIVTKCCNIVSDHFRIVSKTCSLTMLYIVYVLRFATVFQSQYDRKNFTTTIHRNLRTTTEINLFSRKLSDENIRILVKTRERHTNQKYVGLMLSPSKFYIISRSLIRSNHQQSER